MQVQGMIKIELSPEEEERIALEYLRSKFVFDERTFIQGNEVKRKMEGPYGDIETIRQATHTDTCVEKIIKLIRGY